MTQGGAQEPWIAIDALLEQRQGEELERYLDALSPGDVARALSRLPDEARGQVLTLLSPGTAADLLEELSDAQGADLLEELPPEMAAPIVDELVSDDRADILAELEARDLEAILAKMDPKEAREARHLLTYSAETAGGIMITEFVVYREDQTVNDVLGDLRANAELYSDFGVQYAYVESENHALIGVLRLRDLVLAPSDQQIKNVMIVNPVSVLADTGLEDLEQYFDRYPFSGLPVVDHEGRIVGVVQRADAEEAHSERSDRTFMRYSGIVGGEELRNMPLSARSIQRLSWLSTNLVLSIMAAAVIVFFEETVNRVIALAAIIPVLANVSGCSGNQAVAVSIREMTLGLIKPRDLFRVMRQEIAMGLINGAALGGMLGTFTLMWTGNQRLGLVVGVAMALNCAFAVALGGSIPLLLKRFNIDPASAAAPMLTTIVDMCGFFLILSLATVMV